MVYYVRSIKFVIWSFSVETSEINVMGNFYQIIEWLDVVFSLEMKMGASFGMGSVKFWWRPWKVGLGNLHFGSLLWLICLNSLFQLACFYLTFSSFFPLRFLSRFNFPLFIEFSTQTVPFFKCKINKIKKSIFATREKRTNKFNHFISYRKLFWCGSTRFFCIIQEIKMIICAAVCTNLGCDNVILWQFFQMRKMHVSSFWEFKEFDVI